MYAFAPVASARDCAEVLATPGAQVKYDGSSFSHNYFLSETLNSRFDEFSKRHAGEGQAWFNAFGGSYDGDEYEAIRRTAMARQVSSNTQASRHAFDYFDGKAEAIKAWSDCIKGNVGLHAAFLKKGAIAQLHVTWTSTSESHEAVIQSVDIVNVASSGTSKPAFTSSECLAKGYRLRNQQTCQANIVLEDPQTDLVVVVQVTSKAETGNTSASAYLPPRGSWQVRKEIQTSPIAEISQNYSTGQLDTSKATQCVKPSTATAQLGSRKVVLVDSSQCGGSGNCNGATHYGNSRQACMRGGLNMDPRASCHCVFRLDVAEYDVVFVRN